MKAANCLLLFLSILLTTELKAQEAQVQQSARNFELRNAVVGFGNYAHFINAMQVDTSGKTESFNINPYVVGGLEFALPKNKYYLNTEFGLTIPKTTADGSALLTMLFLRADVAYRFRKGRYKLLLGSSLVMTNLKGNGGTVTLNNGGSPQTFYRAEETRTAYNNTLDLGLEYYFSRKWGARLQTIHYSIFDSEQRQMSYLLTFNYYWDVRDKVQDF
ncbi:MAG: hypothetical protein JNM93_02010 [Bacteriovoracaceae bacterium]|nr:hypothetical protein [Bacteriovoracaceae bacterium]